MVALQHRAVMLGSLGVGLYVGTFVHRPSLNLALGMTLVSDISFLLVALPNWNQLTRQLKKVVYADAISILCLVTTAAGDRNAW